MKRKIIPLRKNCDCGNEVKNHHFLCDKCWGKRKKKDFEEDKNKRLNEEREIRKREREGRKIRRDIDFAFKEIKRLKRITNSSSQKNRKSQSNGDTK